MKFSVGKYFISAVLLISSEIQVNAQTAITGTVISSKKEALSGASVRAKDLRTGVNADSAGNFLLVLSGRGKHTLEVSSVGYLSKELVIELNDSTLHLEIELKDASKTLGDVIVISAGSFEASDKAKGASLTPIDAVTVAGNGGDIANAMRSLPGAQQIGEREGLFVRGGSSEETKQFMDGAIVPTPNYSSVPGLPQPARLNPFLFKGILFSSGGYSALYGDALSSTLILESVDLPDKSSGTFSLFPQNISAGFQEQAKDDKSSYGATARYGNNRFYNRLVPQIPDFFQGPSYASGDVNFRIKTSETGMLKFYGMYSYSNVGMKNPDIDSNNLVSSFKQNNTNLYMNLSYRETLGNNWKIDAATAYNYYQDGMINQLLNKENQQLFLTPYPYSQKNFDSTSNLNLAQARVVLRKQFVHNQALRFGAEYFRRNDRLSSNYPSGDSTMKVPDNQVALFAEADIYITKNMAAKIGVRTEYSSLIEESNLAPRISIAYRFPRGGQINMAYGIFYQIPEVIYLALNRDLNFTRATHYILNYQKKADNRLFRIEAYYKSYNDLLTTLPSVANGGNGYAKGIELFWRDKKTFKNFDYWITYTYLDTKRKYLDFPYSLHPQFATPQTLSVVLKKYFQDINLSANLSYSLGTGRPYYDIQTDPSSKPFIYDQGTTNMYNVMNLSFAYLFSIFPKWKNMEFSGIGFGANNIFGTREVFGYYYSYNGHNKTPISPPATRTYYFGLFMSFGIDRRDDFINENL